MSGKDRRHKGVLHARAGTRFFLVQLSAVTHGMLAELAIRTRRASSDRSH
jgi:hypothetical protein